MTASLKSLATQEWVLRLLADGPLSSHELSRKMFLEQWETWAERHGYGGQIEWGSGDEPLGARLLAWGEAKDQGLPALHSWEVYHHLVRMEKHGLVERIVIEGHRPMLWRAT